MTQVAKATDQFAAAVVAAPISEVEASEVEQLLGGPIDLNSIGQGEILDGPLLARIDAYLQKIKELKEEEAEIDQIVDLRMADIRRWGDLQKAPAQRTREYLEMVLVRVASIVGFRRGKSQALPHGKLGRRASSERIAFKEGGEADALAFAKRNKIPIKESVGISALKEYWQATGELPAGCEVVPAEEKPYIDTV